ncbi:MAG: helix-hairpin-helix domain-containing protein [Herbaspirillum sp.]
MVKPLVTSSGVPVKLGRELGKGGEGSVFEVPALATQVAKLYHETPDTKKQAKIGFMAATTDKGLLDYIAWPQQTLHQSPGGPVVGFLMPRVAGRDPVHMVYSPAHRRQERPKAAWDFLLYVARNTAAAFEKLHAHGHVVGDVNQGNVLVGDDSKVVLIDSDSFQVRAPGAQYLCEVGVAHFTPPELQGLSSFNGVERTANHDNFGLALLIFHLLFGARHPYAGVPLRNGVGEALEADIKGFRYAYARDARQRGLAAPPRSIPLSVLPDSMEMMFHLAFTEKGALGGRPTAAQWVHALDGLRKQLRKCSASSMHLYPDHVATCPWCKLEKEGVVYFLDLGATVARTSSGFVLARAWAVIESVPPIGPVWLPNLDSIDVKPSPLPAEIPGATTIGFYRLVVLLIAISVVVAAPKMWFFALLGGFIGWGVAGSSGSNQRAQERAKRKAALDGAQADYNRITEQLKREAGPEGFSAIRADLHKLREEYESLPQAEKHELDRLHSTAYDRHKQKFLDSCFIDNATISGIGPTRKAALRSFGIETAADCDRHRIRQVRGFGEGLTRAIMDWKATCERRFQFNPNNTVSEADKNRVRAQFAARRVAIETRLDAGPGELQRFRQQAAARAASLRPTLEAASTRLAQARKDFALI